MESKPFKFRIIWITPRSPLGAPDGARVATFSLIHHLTHLAIDVDLICMIPAGEPADPAAIQTELKVSSCAVISRSSSKLLRLPTFATPFTFRAFAAPGVRKAFKERLDFLLKAAEVSQDVFLVFDGLHPFAALDEMALRGLSARCRGIVYRAHNVETVFWEQCGQKARTPWFRWFFRYQAALVRSFERRIAGSASLVAPVSDDDGAKFQKLSPEAVVCVTPIGMDFPDDSAIQPVRDSAALDLLFIGRLDWLPNRSGLAWFLETVWPRLVLARPRVSLKIAGVGDGRWLRKYQDAVGVEFLGRVDRVGPIYESCALSIAPLFQGSGTRVKIIESARYARAVVTTRLGAEGTGLVPGSTFFEAQTAEEWIALLKTMTKEECQRVGANAFRRIRDHFDAKTIAESFARALESIPAKPHAV